MKKFTDTSFSTYLYLVDLIKIFSKTITCFFFLSSMSFAQQSLLNNLKPVENVCLIGQKCVGTQASDRGMLIESQENALASNSSKAKKDAVPVKPAAQLSGASHEVRMLNLGVDGVMVFEPSLLQVQLGDTVTFKSIDPGHNSASMAGMIPEGAESWNGGISQDTTVTFTAEGVYVYQCSPHMMMAMVGVIQVGEARNLEAVKMVAAQKKSNFVMEVDRLERYLNTL
jgi:pseudoazurin